MTQEEIVELLKKDDKEELSKYEKTELKEMLIEDIKFDPLSYVLKKEDSASLLHISAMNNSIKCFDYLLNDVQIPINSKSEFGLLPIDYSLKFGSYEMSSHILSIYKNNQNEESSSNCEINLENLFSQDYGNTKSPLTLLYNCIRQNNREETNRLINLLFTFGYDPNKIQSTASRRHIISHACYELSIQQLSILIKHFTPLPGEDGFNVLYDIIRLKTPLLEELIKTGWDVNFIKDGNTLLYQACSQNNEKAVEILLKYMDQIDPPNTEKPAVCLLCMTHNPNIAKMILSKNIDVHRLDAGGNCAPFYLLDVGEEKNNLEILSMLFDHGYDINFKDKNGKSLIGIFLSSIKTQYSIIEWLILHGADLNYTMPGKGHKGTIKEFMLFQSKNNKRIRKIVQKYS